MKKALLVVAGVAAIAPLAAAFQVGNFYPGPGNQQGAFSDAYSTNGNNFWGRTVAETFTLANIGAQNYEVGNLQFWGFGEAFFNAGDSNVQSFEINIFNTSGGLPTTLAYTGNFLAGNVTKVAVDNNAGNDTFSYTVNLGNANIGNGGGYAINIGAIMVDPQDDGWNWHVGIPDDSSFLGNNATVPGTWDGWQVTTTPPDDFAYILDVNPVPEPATMLVLAGVAGLAARRRRK